MENQDFFKKLLSNINKNKSISANKLVKSNPALAAVVSKLINPKAVANRELYKPENLGSVLNSGKLDAISSSASNRYMNNKNILELFPDLELAMQILVSSILSPKDMVEVKLLYRTEDSIFPVELNGQLLAETKAYLNKLYDLDEQLSDILNDALFIRGANIKAVIPESILDMVINSTGYGAREISNETMTISKEAINELYTKDNLGNLKLRNHGILGPYVNKPTIAIESGDGPNATNGSIYENTKTLKVIDSNIEITDNFQLLKLPMALNAIRTNRIRSKYMPSISTENRDTQNFNIADGLFKTTEAKHKVIEKIPSSYSSTRQSVGKPLVLNLPTEAVIPVTLPSEPEKHLGYFVIVDENGSPVVANSTDINYIKTMTTNTSESSMSSYLLNKAKSNLLGNDSPNNIVIDNIMHIYSGLVEDNLRKRLVNGCYDENLSIANNEEVYKIMLARSLANKFTKILYIPSEFVTYFAFDYYDNGIGKSLLDNLKVITGLRAMLLFSKTMAHIKSAINVTTVNLKLDEDDPDPQRTIESTIHEVLRMRQQYFPLGINSAPDLVDWIQRAAIEFSFEGHPGLPDVKLDFDVKNIQHTVPDSELDNDLRKQTYMALGLSPETIDNGFNAEFATTVVSNNILLSKRVSVYQHKFHAMLKDYVGKLLMYDTTIRDKYRFVIMNNLKSFEKYLREEDKELYNTDKKQCIDNYITMFVSSIEVVLPRPDETTIDVQSEAFDAYVSALDKVIDSWISAETVDSSLSGNIGEHMDTIKAIARAYYARKWMTDNNFMSELSELTTSDEDGKPNIDLFDISKSHMESLMKSVYKFIEELKPLKDALDDKLEDEGVESPDESTDDSGMNDEDIDDGTIDEDMTDEDTSAVDGVEEETVDEDTEEEESTDDTTDEDTNKKDEQK